MNGFAEDDIRKLREFGNFLNQKAKFNDMSISDSAKLISYLQFFNQHVIKVEDHLLEVKSVQKVDKRKKE